MVSQKVVSLGNPDFPGGVATSKMASGNLCLLVFTPSSSPCNSSRVGSCEQQNMTEIMICHFQDQAIKHSVTSVLIALSHTFSLRSLPLGKNYLEQQPMQRGTKPLDSSSVKSWLRMDPPASFKASDITAPAYSLQNLMTGRIQSHAASLRFSWAPGTFNLFLSLPLLAFFSIKNIFI